MNVAQELLGKTKNKEDQVYLYKDNNSRHKVEEDWNPFMDSWNTRRYQG